MLLLLLAILLAAAPFLSSRFSDAACPPHTAALLPDSVPDGGYDVAARPCGDVARPVSGVMQGLSILSALCFAGFFVSFLADVNDRRAEKRLLEAAGIPVHESDLPLE